jgi:hypothetical protein
MLISQLQPGVLNMPVSMYQSVGFPPVNVQQAAEPLQLLVLWLGLAWSERMQAVAQHAGLAPQGSQVPPTFDTLKTGV